MKDNNIVHLGKILKESREQQNITLEKMALKTRIKMEHLINLEDEHFKKLPPKIFIKGIISKYCDICGLDKKEMLKQFDNYLIESAGSNNKYNKLFTEHKKIYPKWNLSKIFLIFFAIVVACFILWQVFNLLLPPKIELMYPGGDLTSDTSSVEIIGKVLRAKEFTINDQIINFDHDGVFNYVLALEPGLNIITIKAKNNSGKSSQIIRNVIYNK